MKIIRISYWKNDLDNYFTNNETFVYSNDNLNLIILKIIGIGLSFEIKPNMGLDRDELLISINSNDMEKLNLIKK